MVGLLLLVALFGGLVYLLVTKSNKVIPIKPEGKVVLITGAGSGIGKELALQLIQEGCFIYALDINLKSLQDIYEQKAEFQNRVRCIRVDVTKQADVDAAVAAIKADKKQLFAIVNCAGISVKPGTKELVIQSVAEKDVDDEIKVFYEINVFGTMRMVSAFFPLLLENARGGNYGEPCIANVSSVYGRVSMPLAGAYASGKHAIFSYTDSLRREMYKTGIRVVCFEPGFTKTPLLTDVLDFPVNNTKTLLKERAERWEANYNKMKKTMKFLEPSFVASVMRGAILNKNPRPHYIIDTPVMQLVWLTFSYLPSSWFDFIISKT